MTYLTFYGRNIHPDSSKNQFFKIFRNINITAIHPSVIFGLLHKYCPRSICSTGFSDIVILFNYCSCHQISKKTYFSATDKQNITSPQPTAYVYTQHTLRGIQPLIWNSCYLAEILVINIDGNFQRWNSGTTRRSRRVRKSCWKFLPKTICGPLLCAATLSQQPFSATDLSKNVLSFQVLSWKFCIFTVYVHNSFVLYRI